MRRMTGEWSRTLRGGQTGVTVARPRLEASLTGLPVMLIEAPGGYGKSTAAGQLAASLDVAVVEVRLTEAISPSALLATIVAGCRRAGIPTLATSIDPDDVEGSLSAFLDRLAAIERGTMLVIDEVQRASPEAARWLANLAISLPGNAHLALAGRRLGPDLAALAARLGVPIFGIDALRFDKHEVAAVLEATWSTPPTADEVDMVLARTDGWPAAVSLLASRRQAPTGDATMGLEGATALQLVMDELVAAADTATRLLLESTV